MYLPLPCFGSRTELEFACPSVRFFLSRMQPHKHTHTHTDHHFVCQPSRVRLQCLIDPILAFVNSSTHLFLQGCRWSVANRQGMIKHFFLQLHTMSTNPEWRRTRFISLRLPVVPANGLRKRLRVSVSGRGKWFDEAMSTMNILGDVISYSLTTKNTSVCRDFWTPLMMTNDAHTWLVSFVVDVLLIVAACGRLCYHHKSPVANLNESSRKMAPFS
jgi:hypothetical protein